MSANCCHRAGRSPVSDSDADGTHAGAGDRAGVSGPRAAPLDARFDRYVRLPNSSIRYEDGATSGLATCIVRSGPTDRLQAETVLAISDEVRPVVEWVLQTRAAFSVDDACRAFDDCAARRSGDPVRLAVTRGPHSTASGPEWDRR